VNYKIGIIPAKNTKYFVLRYQGCLGTDVGTVLIFPGVFIGFLFSATKPPIKTIGVDRQSQISNIENIVPK
jgi:hypothetical protein